MSSGIEWTDMSWNPVTGCTKVSEACKYCYAEILAKAMQYQGQPRFRNGFAVTLHPEDLKKLPAPRAPQLIFVCSMSDLFHEQAPDAFLGDIFRTMTAAHWHRFQVLTKRPERTAYVGRWLTSRGGPWPRHIWAGVTVETPAWYSRIACLRRVPAAVRFLSLEPLLAQMPALPLDGIRWVIVGGESGSGTERFRPPRLEWVRGIRDQCVAAGVPFFFKQWGGKHKTSGGCLLDGREWKEFPWDEMSEAIKERRQAARK